MNRRKFLCLGATGAAAAAIAPALPAPPPETSFAEFLSAYDQKISNALNMDAREFSENYVVTLYPGKAFQLIWPPAPTGDNYG